MDCRQRFTTASTVTRGAGFGFTGSDADFSIGSTGTEAAGAATTGAGADGDNLCTAPWLAKAVDAGNAALSGPRFGNSRHTLSPSVPAAIAGWTGV